MSTCRSPGCRKSPHDHAVMSVLQAIRALSDAMDRMHGGMKGDMDMNATDLAALRMLIVREQPRRDRQPARCRRHLRISTASTTKLLDRLSASGHIERRPHPRDRRARIVILTDESRSAFFRHFGERLRAMRGVADRYSRRRAGVGMLPIRHSTDGSATTRKPTPIAVKWDSRPFPPTCVSTDDQDCAIQIATLKRLGCKKIHADQISGRRRERAQLAACLDYLREGNVLAIARVDRRGRSLADLIRIADELRQRDVSLYIAQQNIDTATPMGQMFYAMLGMFAGDFALMLQPS